MTVQAGNITYIGANISLTTTVYQVGDLYPNSDSPEGVVFAVSDNGTSGYVVALNDTAAAGTQWGPTDYSSIINGLANANGQLNQQAVVNAGALSSYPAFQACYDLTPNGTWYLPSSTEMSTLVNSYSNIRNALSTAGTQMEADGYWCSNVTGFRNVIYYYNSNTGAVATVAPAQQSTVSNAVRAIMQF